MSELMLQAVLRMSPNLWSGSEIDVMQRHRRYVQAAEEIASLKKQLAEAKKDADDARRYRWLRSCGEEYCNLQIFNSRGNIEPEALDAAIDQAMREGE